MRVLLQRVSEAELSIAGESVARIGAGLLLYAAVQRSDEPIAVRQLAERIVHLRLFADDRGRMNLSLVDAGVPLLAVPQFTLAADISRGRRPAFSAAMPAAQAAPLYLELLSSLREWVKDLHSGRFGADMQVASINDGPVSFILDSGPERV